MATTVRVLTDTDLPDVLELLARDPVADVMVASRVQRAGMSPGRLGGELWGHFAGDRLTSAVFAGANLVPVQATPESLRAFADVVAQRGLRPASVVGPASSVLPFWRLLEPVLGQPREIRRSQPLMTLGAAPRVAPDPLVRPALPEELPAVLPASIAMFTEEVGVSPLGADGGATYRASVEDLIASGRCYVRMEDGRVVFKADVGAVSSRACLVQGVWVRPDRRRQHLSVSGMAAVVAHARSRHAPLVTLYVNDYNTAARAAYRRVGFTDVGTFATVLL